MTNYRNHSDDPEPGTVAAITIVPVLPDGSLGALVDDDGYASLIHGQVRDGENWLLEASLRIGLEQAGFRAQRIHVVATEGHPPALHLITWMSGDVRPDHGPQPSPLGSFTADELRQRLDDSGVIPGGVSGAWIVADVAASLAADTDEALNADRDRLLTPAYLAADNPRGGSGFGGTETQWEQRRGQIADAIVASGTFLDLGCANGYLMESVRRWTAQRGLDVQPYGVDISPELVAEARRRLPQWADRLHVGDALTWEPADGQEFDAVHLLLDAVSPARHAELVNHALTLVTPGGRLLVGLYVRAGGLEPHVGEQLRRAGLPDPDDLLPERGGRIPMLAVYRR